MVLNKMDIISYSKNNEIKQVEKLIQTYNKSLLQKLENNLETYVDELGIINIIYNYCKGGKLDLQNEYGYTALILASEKNNIEIVKLLIKGGANVDLQNDGDTALMRVSRKNNMDV